MAEDAANESSGYTTLLTDNLIRLSRPGTWLTAAERVDIVKLCRSVDADVQLRAPMAEAALKIAHEPATVTSAWIAGLEQAGLSRLELLEVLAVVSRQGAIDAFVFGVGAEFSDLPDPAPGEPSREVVEEAKLTGWLPTVGPPGPPTAFSAVPAAQKALFEMSSGLYMDMREIFDFSYERDGLARDQMEVVAARTSYLNECFY